MNYGMPYMGSKNKIAEEIIRYLPPAEHFYDLFGGGGAMTHCALLSGKYKYVHYNEFEPLVYKGFKMAVNGEFKNENRWISRSQFYELKETDPYVALCFSFGNSLESYFCSPEVEPYKKATHYAVFFSDFSYMNELLPDFYYFSKLIEPLTDVSARYTLLAKEMHRMKPSFNMSVFDGRSNIACYQLVSKLETLSRLNRLKEVGVLQKYNNLSLTNGSYETVEIEPNSVVYCDPPYFNTAEYISKFDHNKFYDYVRTLDNCFVSEYYMPDDFEVKLEMIKKCTLSASNNNKETVEKLFSTSKYIKDNPLEF